MNAKQPIIIVGAPRSGTNALRDALCSLPTFQTWPCDELNPLWRTGNSHHPDDQLTPALARPDVTERIRTAFERQARKAPGAVLVEKTCANTLRLPFVDAIFPDARYVEIVRDGRDAASSAADRWGSTFDLGYTLRKLRFVPPVDLRDVAIKQVKNRLGRRDRPEHATFSSWGPRWNGIDELIASGASKELVSAHQWAECVSSSRGFVSQLPASKRLTISYEDFTAEPQASLQSICDHFDVAPIPSALERSASEIHPRSVGRWERTPLAADAAALAIIEDASARLQEIS